MTYNEESAIRTARLEFSSPPADNDRSGIQASELDQNWEELTEVGGIFDTGYHVSACHPLQRLMFFANSQKYRARSRLPPMPFMAIWKNRIPKKDYHGFLLDQSGRASPPKALHI